MIKRLTFAVFSVLLCMALSSVGSLAKANCNSIWQRLASMEKNKQYGTIKIDDKINISNNDIKKRFGEPNAIEHVEVMHPPITASVWRYHRPHTILEFRFFLSTTHVNEIVLMPIR